MFGLYPTSFNELVSIFENHKNIDAVLVYGSRAMGNFKNGSDIDLTLIGLIDYHELYRIKDEIEESKIPYKVDISIHSKLSSESLKEHIARVGKVFYKRNEI